MGYYVFNKHKYAKKENASVRRNLHLPLLSNACKMKPGQTLSPIGQEDVEGGSVYYCTNLIGSLAASPHSYDDIGKR